MPTSVTSSLPNQGHLWTVAELARRWAVHEWQVRRWAAAGRIPAVRLGSRWYTPDAALGAFEACEAQFAAIKASHGAGGAA